MKIGILTYHRSHNYGAFLQAYSLSHALDQLDGVSCEIINYNLIKEDSVYKIKKWKRPIYFITFLMQDRMFEQQQKEQLLSGDLMLCDNYNKVLQYAESKYDIVIAGSDEVWRIASRGFPNAYWMPGRHDFIKISYAASGRNPESKFTEEVKNKLSEIYADFMYIGVRDEITGNQIEAIKPKVKVHRNCDPAFLYNRFKPKEKLKMEVCKKWGLDYSKRLIAVMYDRPEIISKLRKRLGRKYEFVCITRPMWNADRNLCKVTPFEWVDIIGGCDYLLSSYFHGMLFALNQNTPFLVIDRRADRDNLETSKLYDFLAYSNITDRYRIASELDEREWAKIVNQIEDEIVYGVDFSSIIIQQCDMFEEFKRELMEFNI